MGQIRCKASKSSVRDVKLSQPGQNYLMDHRIKSIFSSLGKQQKTQELLSSKPFMFSTHVQSAPTDVSESQIIMDVMKVECFPGGQSGASPTTSQLFFDIVGRAHGLLIRHIRCRARFQYQWDWGYSPIC